MIVLKSCDQLKQEIVGGIGYNDWMLKEGQEIGGHTHHYNHNLVVYVGRVHVSWTCDEGCSGECEMEPGARMEIPKHWRHNIKGLTPISKGSCEFAEFDENGKRVNLMDTAD